MSSEGPAIQLVDRLIAKESWILYPFYISIIIITPSMWLKKYRRWYVFTWPISMPIRLILCIPAALILVFACIVCLIGVLFDKWYAVMWAAEDKAS